MKIRIMIYIFLVSFLVACSSTSEDSTPTETLLYKIGGTLNGINGTLVLQNNLVDELTLSNDGSFSFSQEYPDGYDYNITVRTHPVQQLCTITNSVGQVSLSNVTNILINCVHVNQAPIAVDDSNITLKNTPVVLNILDNDSDTDGTLDTASISIVDATVHGTTDINTSDGTVTYTPNSNYIGNDSFTYSVKDNNGSVSNIASVNITINNDTCWVLISDPVLDINQSLGAQRASLVYSNSSDKLYAAWLEGNFNEAYYYVKEYDSNTNTWSLLGSKINQRKVSSYAEPIIKVSPRDDTLRILGYEDNGTFDRGYIVKNWDGSLWNTDIATDDYMHAYDLALGQAYFRIFVARISSGNLVVDLKQDGLITTSKAISEGSHQIKDPHLALQTNDRMVVAYLYTDNYSYSRVRQIENGDVHPHQEKEWLTLGSLESNKTTRQVVSMSMLIDKNDEIVIAYIEQNLPNHGGNEQAVNVKRYHNSSWQLIGDTINGTTTVNSSGTTGSGAGVNRSISLTEAVNGDLYVAWQHKESNGHNAVYTQKYNGTTWSDAAKPLKEDSNIKTPSLAIDAQGRMLLSVMYDSTPGQTDKDDVKVYRCE